MTTPSFSLRLAFAVMVGAIVAAAMTAVGRMPEVAGDPAIAELWQDPGDIAARDLRWGRGGEALHPSPEVEYEFEAIDALGYSAGYDVVDPQGRKWDVKTGDEGQTEVIASRLLWAVGYHQPIVYFVPDWQLKNGPVPKPFAGRFRLSSDHQGLSEWSWSDNPFKDTRELNGLIVGNLLINNWDLKPSNNKIISFATATGSQPGPRVRHRRCSQPDSLPFQDRRPEGCRGDAVRALSRVGLGCRLVWPGRYR
ncbi:MAG: hypothetical protein EXQ50_08895, partial [Acidobacteria bacterium]|nr:hypothetical protein [Acidobacteriota bacterium]